MPNRINKTGFDRRPSCGRPSMDSSVVRNPQRVTIAIALAAAIRGLAETLLGPHPVP